MFLLVFLLFFNCYSKKNMTDERAKERIHEFVFLMAKNQFEAVEKILSSEMSDSENKELFLSNFDDWQLKDTTDIIIDVLALHLTDHVQYLHLVGDVSFLVQNGKGHGKLLGEIPHHLYAA